MGTKSTRQAKIMWFSHILEQYFRKYPKGKVSKTKLIAQFALDNFSSERVGKEILGLFEKNGKIKIDGDNIIQIQSIK